MGSIPSLSKEGGKNSDRRVSETIPRVTRSTPVHLIMSEATRIAPTPSGFLHAGNAVAFLITALLAAQRKARLRLRIDDIDAERSKPVYIDDLFSSLEWLGIGWVDGPRDRSDHEMNWSQALRTAAYQGQLDLLREQGDVYGCTCSRSGMREREGQGLATCDCRARGLPLEAPDTAWRLYIPTDALVRMEQVFGGPRLLRPAELLFDPIVRQKKMNSRDARPAYQIASLVDDVTYGCTFIVRGDDLLPSTACQLFLADRLGLDTFKQVRFLHHPLINDPDGRKLSKSEGASSLRSMRESGMLADGLRRTAKVVLDGIVFGK